jgi:hypothetical protein
MTKTRKNKNRNRNKNIHRVGGTHPSPPTKKISLFSRLKTGANYAVQKTENYIADKLTIKNMTDAFKQAENKLVETGGHIKKSVVDGTNNMIQGVKNVGIATGNVINSGKKVFNTVSDPVFIEKTEKIIDKLSVELPNPDFVEGVSDQSEATTSAIMLIAKPSIDKITDKTADIAETALNKLGKAGVSAALDTVGVIPVVGEAVEAVRVVSDVTKAAEASLEAVSNTMDIVSNEIIETEHKLEDQGIIHEQKPDTNTNTLNGKINESDKINTDTDTDTELNDKIDESTSITNRTQNSVNNFSNTDALVGGKLKTKKNNYSRKNITRNKYRNRRYKMF